MVVMTHEPHPALSASRLKSFLQCPLKFRFEVIDKIETGPQIQLEKGTLVHAILEDFFDREPEQRTREVALDQVIPYWDKRKSEEPELASALFSSAADEQRFIDDATQLLGNYFNLENPARIRPTYRERYVHVTTPEGIHLHGYMDRVDIARNGAVRIVDYKTGKKPAQQYMGDHNLQMLFYGLMWKLDTGELPARLQLYFFRNTDYHIIDPTPADIDHIHERICGLWNSIKTMLDQRNFPTQTGPLCNWCDFKDYCPAFGGQLPPLSDQGAERLASVQDTNA